MDTSRPAAAAGTWRLGDHDVNRLGLGTMRLPGTGAFDAGVPRDRDTAIRVLRRAVELGVDHLDTAAFYFSALRSANELVNAALAPYDDGLVIVTKVGPGRDPAGGWLPWARPDQLRGQVEENLRQLGLDRLTVVNLRMQGSGPLAEHLGALTELVQAGLIGHLGVSNVSLAQLDEALELAPIVCVQNRHSVGSRRSADDAVLARCGERGIAFVPFFAIAGGGREAGPRPEQLDVVEAVARAHDATPAQVRLAWTLALGEHVLAIPGTGDPAHLEANVAAAALRLSAAEVEDLSGVTSS